MIKKISILIIAIFFQVSLVYAQKTYVEDFKMTWDGKTMQNIEYKSSNMLEVSDGFIIVGDSFGETDGLYEGYTASDPVNILKINKQGKIIWQTEIEVDMSFPPFSITETQDNHIMVNIANKFYILNQDGTILKSSEELDIYNYVATEKYYFVIGEYSENVIVLDSDLNIVKAITLNGKATEIYTESNKVYILNHGEQSEISIIDENLEMISKKLNNITYIDTWGLDDSMLIKVEDCFYLANPSTEGIYRIDNNYNAEIIIPFEDDSYIENNKEYVLDLNSITYRENYYIVGGTKCYGEMDYGCQGESSAIIRIYDKDINLIEEININQLLGYENYTNANTDSRTIIIGDHEVSKLIPTNYGFLVGGALYNLNGESLESKAFAVHYAFEHTINIKTDNNGILTTSKEKSTASKEITYEITANEGYELEKITISDNEGNIITSTDNIFIMPNSDVNIEVTFVKKSQLDNPETRDLAIISCIMIIILAIGIMIHNTKKYKEII